MNNPLKEKCTVVLYYCYLCRDNLKVTSRLKCCKVYSFEAGYACGECNRPFSSGFELRKRKVKASLTTGNVRVYVSASNVYFELAQNKDDLRTDVTSEGSKCAETDRTGTGCIPEKKNHVSNIYSSTDKTFDRMCNSDEHDECKDVDEMPDYSTFAEYIKKHANTGKTSDDAMCTANAKREHGECLREISDNSMLAEDEPAKNGKVLSVTMRADDVKEQNDSYNSMITNNMLKKVEQRYTGNELDDTIPADNVKRKHGDSSGTMIANKMLTEVGYAYTGNVLDDTICADDVKREHRDSCGGWSEDNMLTEDTFELFESKISRAHFKDQQGGPTSIDMKPASGVSGVKVLRNTGKIFKKFACAESITKQHRGIGSVCKELVKTRSYGKSCEASTTKAKTKRANNCGKILLGKNKKPAADQTVKSTKRNKSKSSATEPSGIWPFKCEVCSLEFRSQPNLISHHSVHKRKRKKSCLFRV